MQNNLYPLSMSLIIAIIASKIPDALSRHSIIMLISSQPSVKIKKAANYSLIGSIFSFPEREANSTLFEKKSQ